jgi:hypothetical protein
MALLPESCDASSRSAEVIVGRLRTVGRGLMASVAFGTARERVVPRRGGNLLQVSNAV